MKNVFTISKDEFVQIQFHINGTIKKATLKTYVQICATTNDNIFLQLDSFSWFLHWFRTLAYQTS